MIRKKKSYVKPRKSFEASRISEENSLVRKYGLKNKKEIWKTLAKINYYRKRAMVLSRSSPEEQEVLLNKLKNLGLKVENTADILGLKVENLLERRLPTVVASKNLAPTVKSARQLVVHKKILVDGKTVNTPSYIVSVQLEDSIKLKQKKKASPKTTPEPAPSQEPTPAPEPTPSPEPSPTPEPAPTPTPTPTPTPEQQGDK
tara:strand:+ start:7883 stop:8488 length:606 start_codon:yes stop_codon:yes gene_type:complete